MKKWLMFESPYLCNLDHFHTSFHMYGYHFISRRTKQICADIHCYGVAHVLTPATSVLVTEEGGGGLCVVPYCTDRMMIYVASALYEKYVHVCYVNV